MWPAVSSVVYYLGIGVQALLAALLGQRMGLRASVPVAISVCYLLGMSIGAKALDDIGEGRFDPATLLRREHFVAGGFWGGPAVYLGLAVPVVLGMVVFSGQRSAVSVQPSGGAKAGGTPTPPSRKPESLRPKPEANPPISPWRVGLDLIALAMPIPMAIAKLACLCGGCCHGKPTSLPWAITFPPGGRVAPSGIPLHPTQLYDALILLVLAATLFALNRPRWRGMLLLWFVGSYSLGRLLTEFTRGDLAHRAVHFWGPLTTFQWLCAATAGACCVVLILCVRRNPLGRRVGRAELGPDQFADSPSCGRKG